MEENGRENVGSQTHRKEGQGDDEKGKPVNMK